MRTDPLHRTPEELTAYVKRLEELAWKAVGETEEYQQLMEEAKLDHCSYVAALEHLILAKAGGTD